jgi:hypothetical protein
MRAGYLNVTGTSDMPVLIRFLDPLLAPFTAVKRSRYTHAESMIRKSGSRFLRKDHAQSNRLDHDAIPRSRIMIGNDGKRAEKTRCQKSIVTA